MKMNKEKIVLAVIYKENNLINIEFPNNKDVHSFELYGFLKIYLDNLEYDLSQSFMRDENE